MTNVIDNVTPDVVAVELCKRRVSRTEGIMSWKPEDATLYKLFRKSMRAPGGLCMKIYIFILYYRSRRLHANGVFPGLEFKVATEESSRVGARCFCIDQDIDLSGVSYFDLLWKAYRDYRLSVCTDFVDEKYTRSFVREISSIQKKGCPYVSKVMIEDRDKFMFTNLRSFQGKVVAVVGMAHMDGIELLWKLSEEDDSSKSSVKSEVEGHYQHGIPGIPTDGKVVLLKNSNNEAQIYLVGTVHICKQSVETVKKVEQCKKSATGIMNWKPEDATFYKLFRKSMRAPGGLCRKFGTFFMDCQYRRMHADGIFPGLEFKVAIEESFKVGARCFYIDQDINLWFTYDRVRNEVEDTRSCVQEMQSSLKKLRLEIFKVMVEDRDKFMFANLRSLQGKVVAVVGMGHMDGIELLWRQAEEGDNSSVFIT
ncbi:hypothetical protein MKW98_005944, partial [Papaver atlanticum]